MAALGTAAVKSYADYEQLVGGIETLFGTGGAATVQEYADSVGKSVDEVQDEFNMLTEAQTTAMNNANQAYKTAGLSANEYMDTVTSFAASLKASTSNEVEAAEAANSAVIDMADNANKMGTNMESIQNAYQGFAKQNYTMLDNLKLGYGGTKEEMERLLSDAEKIHQETTGEATHYDINNLSDVYSAIHEVQTQLGITGTTAKEASTTISGSVNAMKASWSNLVTGIADDNANFDELINNFVESAGTAAENIIPRVEIALNGIGELIETLLPIIFNEIPIIINNVLPGLIEAGINIVNSLVSGIESNLPSLILSAGEIINQLFSAFIEMFPSILAMGAQILSSLLSGIQDNLPSIVEGAMSIIEQFIITLISMLPQIIETGMQLLIQLAFGIAQALPDLIPQIVEVMLAIVDTLLDNIDLLLDAALQLIIGLAEGLINSIPVLIEKLPTIIEKLVSSLISLAPRLGAAALKLILALAEGLLSFNFHVVQTLPKILEAIVNGLINGVSKIRDVGKNLVEGLWNGINDKVSWITEKIKGFGENVLSSIKGIFGIHSPSKEFAWIGKMCVAGFDDGMEDLGDVSGVQKNISASLSSMKRNVSGWNGSAGYVSYSARESGNEINYNRMAKEFADALDGMSVKLNNRQAGRIIREVL